ncbi:HepT-like ribonuclease domain-containing protein [Agromyces humatus]|uniref:DUF86 domain-containing protein n=1 Tax=Agromyces humatus TaxID=279573 RepID=A0ABP4WNW0_9MICO|nr:HepT-like ribonuclease domain-containing protein [Agromyces humatus]
MKADARIDRRLSDLLASLETAARLVDRGRAAFDTDPAIALAFEALSNRVGEIAKRLTAADATRFSQPIWAQAARNRDVVVHHYDRIDRDALWKTVTLSFPELRAAAAAARA